MPVATASLPADGRAPRDARRLVANLAGAAGVDDELLETALLLVTELVTNAVVHGGGAVGVSVEVHEGVLSVRVSDAASGPLLVMARPAGELAEGGRGLQLVDALASAWGTEHSSGRKTLWFRLGSASQPGPSAPEPNPLSASHREPLSLTDPALRALLLDPHLEAQSTPDEQLRELVARGADVLRAELLELWLDESKAPLVRHGERPPGTQEELCADLSVLGARAGELRAVLAGTCGPDERALLELLAARLSLLITENRLSAGERRRRDRFEFLAEGPRRRLTSPQTAQLPAGSRRRATSPPTTSRSCWT